jgi:hypothetical protein
MSRGIEEAVLRRTSPSLWQLPTCQRSRLDTVLPHTSSAQALRRDAGQELDVRVLGPWPRPTASLRVSVTVML